MTWTYRKFENLAKHKKQTRAVNVRSTAALDQGSEEESTMYSHVFTPTPPSLVLYPLSLFCSHGMHNACVSSPCGVLPRLKKRAPTSNASLRQMISACGRDGSLLLSHLSAAAGVAGILDAIYPLDALSGVPHQLAGVVWKVEMDRRKCVCGWSAAVGWWFCCSGSQIHRSLRGQLACNLRQPTLSTVRILHGIPGNRNGFFGLLCDAI